jgi:DNA-3-methyladenine glycosylase
VPRFTQASILPRSFYSRPASQVAHDLIGMILNYGGAAGRIVETEAYLASEDRAAHAWRGLTERTRVLFGPPGHVYVFFIYGKHECLNLVAEPEGVAGCVLVRAVEPLAGLALMRSRRPAARRDEELAAGPGRLTAAFAISRRLNGADATRGPLTVHRPVRREPFEIDVTPRIGIRHCADWPLRFLMRGNPCVSR